MNAILIGAGSHLGVHVDGADAGAAALLKESDRYDHALLLQEPGIVKSLDISDHRKNEAPLMRFNTALYQLILEKTSRDLFPILIGGDHSVVIASALASVKKWGRTGIIWIDAHTDFNTFESTLTGNIHGLPLAAVTGYRCESLRSFHTGMTIDPKNAVVIGARAVDAPEWINLRDAGVTVFSTRDILSQGPEAILRKAFRIAGAGTNGIHVSYDLDVIDPVYAPGVSVPEKDGIDDITAFRIMDILCAHLSDIRSFDLVEFNPLRDIDDRTKKLAVRLIEKLLDAIGRSD